MAIPNVKRFRPFCPSCNDSFTVMAVLPKDTNVDAYLTDVVARHDHKAFQESKLQHFKIRVGQTEAEESEVIRAFGWPVFGVELTVWIGARKGRLPLARIVRH